MSFKPWYIRILVLSLSQRYH